MRMRHVAGPGGRGHPKPHIWNQQRRLRGVYMGAHHCKAVFGRKSPVKTGPKMAVFRELRGVSVKFLFSNPEKAHPCAEPRRLTYYA